MTDDEQPDLSNQPATKADLQALRVQLEKSTDERLRRFRDEIKYHFDAAVENIHKDLAGANKDEVSSLKDVGQRLHDRVALVERQLGLEPPPAP